MTAPAMTSLGYAVYRLYDAEGRSLYIGCTSNLPKRLGTHRREKRWWRRVSEQKVDYYATRAEALAAESAALAVEKPVHNVHGVA